MAWTLWSTITNGMALHPTMNNFRKHLPNCPKHLETIKSSPTLALPFREGTKSKTKLRFALCLLLSVIFFFSPLCRRGDGGEAAAQPTPTKTRILFVFDDSFSMFG